MPIFCFYCGQICHNEKLCAKRKEDVALNKVKCDQYGHWLRAENKRKDWLGYKENKSGKGQEEQREDISLQIISNVCKERGDNVREKGSRGERGLRLGTGIDQIRESMREVRLEKRGTVDNPKITAEGYEDAKGMRLRIQ